MAYLDIPDLWMVVRLAMALASISWAHVVNFLLAGILIGDLAAVPSHGAEEDVTLLEGKMYCSVFLLLSDKTGVPLLYF